MLVLVLELLVGRDGNAGGTGTETWAGFCGGGGMLEVMKGEEETGIDARGGDLGLAGRTVAVDDWIEELIRFSISSMSDWEDGWSGIVSLCC